MRRLTVAASLARGLADLAASRGVAREDLLRASGIASAALDDHDRRLPLDAYVRLTRIAAAMAGDAALALHYGESIDLSEISLVGLLSHASETMMEALQQLNRYGRLVVEVETGSPERFQLQRDARGLWIVDTRSGANAFPELTETTFARMISGARRLSAALRVHEVQVTHGDPGYRGEYDRVFGAPTRFHSSRNAMLIDESWLTHRVAVSPRYAFAILSGHADRLVRDMAAATTMRGQVESRLMRVLHKGKPSMAEMASAVGLSRQTLLRRLKSEGTTFEGVIEQLRRSLAEGYLGGQKLSVNQTAYLLGYSDPAAFSRAFKRWTGASPKAARAIRPTAGRSGGA